MFNNRVVIAQAETLRKIFLAKNKDYSDYAEVIKKYNGPFKALAAWLMARDFEKPQVDDIVGHLDPYIKKGRLKPDEIVVSPSYIQIKDSEAYEELDPFVNFIHGSYPVALIRSDKSNESTEKTPVLVGNGIKIFEVNNADDSRQLAHDTSWCIAYPGQNNMWTSYRSSSASTFFIVFDDNPPTSDQRKVAIDFNYRGVQLTDIKNFTGEKLSNNMDWDDYSKYLKSKGIDLEKTRTNPETGEDEIILKNKPLSEEEKFFMSYYQFATRGAELTVEDIKLWPKGLIQIKSQVTPQEYNRTEFRDSREKELFLANGYDRDLNKILELQLKGSGRVQKRFQLQKDQIVSIVDNRGFEYSVESEPKIMTLDDIIGGQAPTSQLNDSTLDSILNENNPITKITLKNGESKNYLTKFIGMGYELPDEIFEYVVGLPDAKDLLLQYVDSGIELPEIQIKKIKEVPSLFKTYARKQLIALSRNGIEYAHILRHLDPDDQKTRDMVLDTLLPKDVINIHSKKIHSILDDIKGVPEEWLKIPQLSIPIRRASSIETHKDTLERKVALCMGEIHPSWINCTVEEALIYLNDQETVSKFKDEAIAQKYLPAIFEPFFDINEYKNRLMKIPFDVRNDPAFNKYNALVKVGHSSSDISYNKTTHENLAYEEIAVRMIAGDIKVHYGVVGDKEFWLYFINNYQSFYNTIFKNIGYEITETIYRDAWGDIVDESLLDSENNEYEASESTVYDKDRQRASYIYEFERSLKIKPYLSVMETPEIWQALETNFPEQALEIIYSRVNRSEIISEYVSQSINSFSDIPDESSYIFEKDNPIIRKITQNGFDVDKFVEKYKFRAFYNIIQLDSWNPELVDSISDDDFLKILRLENGFGDHHILWLEQNRPKVLVKLFNETLSNLLFSYEQRQYIGKNVLPKLQQPEQIEEPAIEEPVIEEPAPTSEAEEMPEEPTTASIKLMVKIARILDLKKEYRLADKLTYMF